MNIYGLHTRANDGTTPLVPSALLMINGAGPIWASIVELSNIEPNIAYELFSNARAEVQNLFIDGIREILENLEHAETLLSDDPSSEEAELCFEVARAEKDKLKELLLDLEFRAMDPQVIETSSDSNRKGSETPSDSNRKDSEQSASEEKTIFEEYITGQGLEPAYNVMNMLLMLEGKFLSEEQYNLAAEMQVDAIGTLMEALGDVLDGGLVDFDRVLSGEVGLSNAEESVAGMGYALDAAREILRYFEQGENVGQGVPSHDYGEYQGVAAAGYGAEAPADFQEHLEAAWDVLAGHGISADEYESISAFDKQIILDHARAYERSGGRDVYAAEEMVNATFAGLPSGAIEDVFDVPLRTTHPERIETIRDGFSRVFKFYDVVDQPIFPFLKALVTEIERASGIPVTAERLAEGLHAFRSVGFTSYRPDILVSVLTNVCAKFANANDLVVDVLSSDAFCSPERTANAQMLFSKKVGDLFMEFCELTVEERMVDVELNNYDIAQMLDLRGSDLDELAIQQLNSQIANEFDSPQLIEDVRRVVAPEVKSPVKRVTVPKADSSVANKIGAASSSKDPSKVAAIATIGITAVALGFLANKLRKL